MFWSGEHATEQNEPNESEHHSSFFFVASSMANASLHLRRQWRSCIHAPARKKTQATIGISGHCHIIIVSLFSVCRGLELPPIKDQLDDDRNQDGGGHHKQTGECRCRNHVISPDRLMVTVACYQTGNTGNFAGFDLGLQYGFMIVSGRAT